ncbi:hypothetical protein [Alienimonas chondri]|uniref:hypothetical protein n=1 Tax=Alienimonas chondri TaxID=2681879 RepID=UPI001487ADB3|nr:hypothetical protein [Alienimonas chondri]
MLPASALAPPAEREVPAPIRSPAPAVPSRFVPPLSLVAFLGTVLTATLSAGCGGDDDPIAVYTVPTVEPGSPAAAPVTPPFAGGAPPFAGGMTGVQTPDEPQRLLGAIYAGQVKDGALWYFKLSGPVADVAAAEEGFRAWLTSASFDGAEPTWTVPDGWTERPGSGMRTATLIAPGGAEATLIQLGVSGDLEERIDADLERWRGQVGATGEAGDVEEVPLSGDGTALLLDVSTPPQSAQAGANTGAGMGGGEAPAGPVASAVPFEYDLPEGWLVAPTPAMSRMAIATGTEDDAALVTITRFPAGAMTIEQVAGIWRGQAKTAAWEPADDAAPIDVGGADAVRVELPPEEAGGPTVLGAALTRGEALWLFKLTGDEPAVAAETPAFETFLAGLRFPEATADSSAETSPDSSPKANDDE